MDSQSNREKEKDLVATGILPVILNRQAGSLSHQFANIIVGALAWPSPFHITVSRVRQNRSISSSLL
jgi:hypothetical protein